MTRQREKIEERRAAAVLRVDPLYRAGGARKTDHDNPNVIPRYETSVLVNDRWREAVWMIYLIS